MIIKKPYILISILLLIFCFQNTYSQETIYNICKGAVVLEKGDTLEGFIRIDRGLTTHKFVTFIDKKDNKNVYLPSNIKEFYYFKPELDQPIKYVSDINPINNRKEFFRIYGQQPVILYRIAKTFGFSYTYFFIIKKDDRFITPPCKSVKLYSYLANNLPECPEALENIHKSDMGSFDKDKVMAIYGEYYR